MENNVSKLDLSIDKQTQKRLPSAKCVLCEKPLNEIGGRRLVASEKYKWTKEAIDRAKIESLKGFQPWFCQVCGSRQCSVCGHPINYPGAADILYDDGSSTHCPAFAGGQGCINPNCEKYRVFIFNGIDPRIKK